MSTCYRQVTCRHESRSWALSHTWVPCADSLNPHVRPFLTTPGVWGRAAQPPAMLPTITEGARHTHGTETAASQGAATCRARCQKVGTLRRGHWLEGAPDVWAIHKAPLPLQCQAGRPCCWPRGPHGQVTRLLYFWSVFPAQRAGQTREVPRMRSGTGQQPETRGPGALGRGHRGTAGNCWLAPGGEGRLGCQARPQAAAGRSRPRPSSEQSAPPAGPQCPDKPRAGERPCTSWSPLDLSAAAPSSPAWCAD